MAHKRFLSPFTWPVLSFLAVIAAGAALLSLPFCRQGAESLSFMDACFLATSAVCVTGLTPVDVSATLSLPGQTVLLCLMQTGGLGVMTYTSLIFLLWGNHVPFRSREAVSQALLWGSFSLARFLRQVVGLTFGIEAAAALGLWLHDPVFFHPFSAVFHAVSAFCNAGFTLCPTNLMPFRDDVAVNAIIIASVFLGGIGFEVLRELLGICTGRRMGARTTRLNRASRVALKTSVALVVAGWAIMFALEAFRDSTAHQYLGMADLGRTLFFHAAAARTAGFNTTDVATLSQASLLVLMLLMFIGGGPGSCAGGIKVITFRVLAGYVASQFRGDRQIVLEGRGIPEENVGQALRLFFLYSLAVAVSLLLLTITEGDILRGDGQRQPPLLPLLFECVSALGTTGLSLGVTADMSAPGKAILMVCMFTGRVGMLTLLMAVQSLRARKPYAVAEAPLPIG